MDDKKNVFLTDEISIDGKQFQTKMVGRIQGRSFMLAIIKLVYYCHA